MLLKNVVTLSCGVIAATACLAMPTAANAQKSDQFKVVIGNAINWDNQALQLGQDVGIYKRHGITLDSVGAGGGGETIQAVISGSADIGGPIAMAGAYRAFARGAPIRILLPMFTGDNTYWYVRADSPIKSLKDATNQHTISYSTSGSTTDLIVQGFIREFALNARPVRAGGMAATFPQVMAGKVDIGWAAPPFGLDEIEAGNIRIVARGSDLSFLKGQTVRVLMVNERVLKTRPDAIARFVRAYRESVDWMYSDPKAVEMYAAKVKRPVGMIRKAVDEFMPKQVMQYERVADIEGSMRDAISFKFIDKPLSKEQLDQLIQIPPVSK